jgi:hypothetical protein
MRSAGLSRTDFIGTSYQLLLANEKEAREGRDQRRYYSRLRKQPSWVGLLESGLHAPSARLRVEGKLRRNRGAQLVGSRALAGHLCISRTLRSRARTDGVADEILGLAKDWVLDLQGKPPVQGGLVPCKSSFN